MTERLGEYLTHQCPDLCNPTLAPATVMLSYATAKFQIISRLKVGLKQAKCYNYLGQKWLYQP